MTHTPNMVMAQSRRPIYHLVPHNGGPVHKTFRGAVYNRFVGWIETASLSAIGKTLAALGTLAALSLLAWKPHLVLNLFLLCLRSVSFRIPLVLGAFLLLLNARRIWRWGGRRRWPTPVKSPTANQYMLEGVPVHDIASFLLRTGAWKHGEAIDDLKITEGQHERIAEVLDEPGILVRGTSNARVLRPISHSHLITQLRALAKGLSAPLMWDEVNQIWVERDDPYGRFLREKTFRQRKLEEETARTERKAERAQRKLEKVKEEIAVLPQVQLGGEDSVFAAIMGRGA